MQTRYSGISTAQINPNKSEVKNEWKNLNKAVGHVDETYAISYYTKVKTPTHYVNKTVYDKYGKASTIKEADKWKDVYHRPHILTFHTFGFDIPENAKIKKIKFIARIKLQSGTKSKILAPIVTFENFVATQSHYDNTKHEKGWQTGWNNGTYAVVPKSTYLTSSFNTYSYTMDYDDIKKGGIKADDINNKMWGIDVIWQESDDVRGKTEKDTTTCAVGISWVKCVVDYEVEDYKVTITLDSPLRTAVDTTKVKAVTVGNLSHLEYSTIQPNNFNLSKDPNEITSENTTIFNGLNGTESSPYPIYNHSRFKLIVKATNETSVNLGGNRWFKIDVPWGTEIYGDPVCSSGEYDPSDGYWKVPAFANKSETCKITLKPKLNGLNCVTAKRQNSIAKYYYFVNQTDDLTGISDISIVANTEAKDRQRFCCTLTINGQSNDGSVAVFVENSKEFLLRQDLGDFDRDTYFTLNENLSTDGVVLDGEYKDNNTYACNLSVPEDEPYVISLNYCGFPIGTGDMTLNAYTSDDSTRYSETFNVLANDGYGFVVTPDTNKITTHRVYSEVETDSSIIECTVDEFDSNMVMSDCSINMNILEDLDYIGCVPLEHLHFDPKSTYKDTLLNSTYKNKRYMGKKLATDEDITLNVRLHPQQVTTIQGLIEMDKPIPINANHRCFESDALNHRGWAEIYGIKTEETNPHWYKCDIDVKYLTHNLKTRFMIERGDDIDDYTVPQILTEVWSSGDELTDGSDEENDFFRTETNGTYIYVEDYDDVEIDDTERNVFNIDNQEYINIKTVKPLSNTSQVSFNWKSSVFAENRENHVEKIIRLVDDKGNDVFKYQYDDIQIGNDEITGTVLYSVNGESGNGNITFRTEFATSDEVETDDDIENDTTVSETTYGSTLHFIINNNILTVKDDGFTGSDVLIENMKLSGNTYYYVVEWTNKNEDGETDGVNCYFDFAVQDTVLTTNYSENFSNMIISPFPVADKQLLFTRQGEEGVMYYYHCDDEEEEFSYIIEPYYQYQNGTDLVTDDGVSIFNLNYGYDIVYIQNGLVRLGFNRFDNEGHMYLGKYDAQLGQYVTTHIMRLNKFTDLNLNMINDDKIEVQASDSTFTIYRGHPYIKINHNTEDIYIDTKFTSVWAERVGDSDGTDLPSYWDLMNNDNLLPDSVGSANGIKSSALTIEEINIDDKTDTDLKWVSAPSEFYVGSDATFSVGDTSYHYEDRVSLDGYECSFGSYEFSVESDGLPHEIYLFVDKDIIQTGDNLGLSALVRDGANGLANQVVEFYEVYEPYHLYLKGNKNIIQSSETVNLTATLKDEDGSLIEGETVYFYEIMDYYEYYETISEGDNVVELALPSKFKIEFDLEVTGTSSTSNAFIRFNSSSGTYCGKGSSSSNNISFGSNVLEQITNKTTYAIVYNGTDVVFSSPTNSITVNNVSLTSLYSLSRNGATVMDNIRITDLSEV